MARVKLSELTAKKLLHNYLEIPYFGNSDPDSLDTNKKYVVKVDEGIKKRMKRGLLAIDSSPDQVRKFISEMQAKGFKHFIIEEMVPHDQAEERYIAIERVREGFRVFYSQSGGIDIEESQSGQETIIHAENETDETALIEQKLGVPQLFISQVLGVMNKYHFSFVEINPLVVMENFNIHILDLAVEVDSAGKYFVEEAWKEDDFRFGEVKEKTDEEKNIENLSVKSQASFKFVPLNPNGSIFVLLSGGGASIVIADEVANLGYGKELANYGEYSGNPNEEETYLYTKNLLSFLLKSGSNKKVLIIAGGVANFTDIRITFRGIIKAVEEVKEELKKHEVKVFVRRGGPNQEEGLKIMRDFLKREDLFGEVKGPEMILTDIVKEAVHN